MSGALILNASYEPLSVVNVRRAVVLVLRGKAVTVEERRDHVFHSESLTVPVPSVVKLVSYVRVPHQRVIPVTRRGVFGRDGNRCQYCMGPAESIDHVIPRSKGGGHTWDNVVACCRRCNVRKGDRLPSEIGYALKRRPGPPSPYGWIFANSGYPPDPAWQQFLAVPA